MRPPRVGAGSESCNLSREEDGAAGVREARHIDRGCHTGLVADVLPQQAGSRQMGAGGSASVVRSPGRPDAGQSRPRVARRARSGQ
eukprot:5409633-Prymnesium_polylepis.4